MKNKENRNDANSPLPKFGVLDAVIIILVVAAICGIYFRYNIMDAISARRNIRDYDIEFSIDNINFTTTGFLNENDQIRFASDGTVLGVLIKDSDGMSENILSITPASETFSDNGQVIEVYYPEGTRVDVRGTLRCSGTYSDEGIFLVNGSTSLSSGELINVRTDEVSVALRVLSISVFE